MPAAILSRSLLYLFGATTGEEVSSFNCSPWSEPVWRACFGLVPLHSPHGEQDQFVNIDDDTGSQEHAHPEDGFVFAATALKQVGPTKLQTITDGRTLIQAQHFMEAFWKLWCGHSDRGKPIESVVDLLPPEKKIADNTAFAGYSEYKDVVLTMLNRRGGVLEVVGEVMTEFWVTPVERWKDDRETNRKRKGRLALPEYKVPLPAASTAVESREVLAAVARRLFGGKAVSSGGFILPEYQKTVTTLIYRKHESLYRMLKTRRDKSENLCTILDRCIQVAHKERTPAALRSLSKALVEWRKIAVQTLETDDPPFLSREAQVKDLWAELGFEDETEAAKKQRRGLKPKTPDASLPSQAEMELAFEYYVEEYCNSVLSNDIILAPDLRPFYGVHDLTDGEIDIGVQHLKNWSMEKLWESLGLAGRPIKEAAVPLWHQVVGVHAILEGAFTSKIGQRSRPTLLCDEVGLGKTFQLIGVFSVLAHLYEQQMIERSKQLPPPPFTIAKRTTYFNGEERIPNLPSLVISPRTLSSQWTEQWDKFTHHGGFLVVRYSVDQGSLEDFSTKPNGAYRKAAGPNLERASKVIVIADTLAISKEAMRCLEPPPEFYQGKSAQLEEARGEVAEFWRGIEVEGSILSMQFRVTAVDEIHNLQNCGFTQRGVMRITENSRLVVGATATPLFTTFMDIAAEGRVIRYRPMIGDQGQDHCKTMMEATRRQSNEWDLNSAEIIESAILRDAKEAAQLAGISTNDSQFKDLRLQAQGKYESEDQVSILKKAFVTQDAIDLLRRVMRPAVIRRTGDSQDFAGKPVLQQAPIKYITAFSPMSEEEREELAAVNRHHQQVKDAKAKAKQAAKKRRKAKEKLESGDIRWKNFLLDQKNASMHKELVNLRRLEVEQGLKEGQLLNKLIKEWNESNIREKASTRMLKVDKILDKLWEGNPKPPIFREDGSIDPLAQALEPIPSDIPRKFLIYVGYRSHRNLIGKMFDIKKRGYVYYDGSMVPSKRQKAVDQFNKDPNTRIMIISNVGAAGLNLTTASVVIIVSNVWSGQEKCQIIGRVHQFGQLRDVLVYDIVAPDGIDLALLGYSDSKTNLSNRFLMSQRMLKKAYLEVTEPTDEYNDSEDEDSSDQETARQVAKPSKISGRRKRKQPDVDGPYSMSVLDQGSKGFDLHNTIKRAKTVENTQPSGGQSDLKSTPRATKKSKAMAGASLHEHHSQASTQTTSPAKRLRLETTGGKAQQLQEHTLPSAASSEQTQKARVRPKPKGPPKAVPAQLNSQAGAPEKSKESMLQAKADTQRHSGPAVAPAVANSVVGLGSRLKDTRDVAASVPVLPVGNPQLSPPSSPFTFELSTQSQGSSNLSTHRRTGFAPPPDKLHALVGSQSSSRSVSGKQPGSKIGQAVTLGHIGPRPSLSSGSGTTHGTRNPVASVSDTGSGSLGVAASQSRDKVPQSSLVPQSQAVNNNPPPTAFYSQRRTGFRPPVQKAQGSSVGSSSKSKSRNDKRAEIESVNVLEIGDRPAKVARLASKLHDKGKGK